MSLRRRFDYVPDVLAKQSLVPGADPTTEPSAEPAAVDPLAEEIPHFDICARVILAMQDAEIARQFDARELLDRTTAFIGGLKMEADHRRIML